MAYKIPINERFGAKVLSFSKLHETISDIRSKLSEDQLTLFRGTCFGTFLQLKNIKWAPQIVHQLLLRQVQSKEDEKKGKLVFLIGGRETSFSIREFNLITGLRCHSLPDISLYLKEMEKSGEPRVGLQNKYFNGSYHISCQELRMTFMQCQDPEDVYKLALVYFVEYVLLGRDVKLLIDVDFLNLVDYVDEFNKYPWGTLSYKKTIQSLTNCLVGRSDKFKAKQNDFEWYNLLGFPWAFQLWVYEVIPSIAASFADCVDLNLLPRMLKWSSTKAPKSKTVNDILEADEVTVFEMVNTHSESEQDYTFNCEGNVGVLLKKAKKAKQPIQHPGADSDVSSVKKSDDTFEMGLLVSSLIRGLVKDTLAALENKLDEKINDISVGIKRKIVKMRAIKKGKHVKKNTLRRSSRLMPKAAKEISELQELEKKKKVGLEELISRRKKASMKKKPSLNDDKDEVEAEQVEIGHLEKGDITFIEGDENLATESKEVFDKVISDIIEKVDQLPTETTDDDDDADRFYVAPHVDEIVDDDDRHLDNPSVAIEKGHSVDIKVDDKVDNYQFEVDNSELKVDNLTFMVDHTVATTSDKVDTNEFMVGISEVKVDQPDELVDASVEEMVDGSSSIANEEDDTDANKLRLLAKLATEGQQYQSKRLKKRGPYQVSPYTDPSKKKRKILPEFNPISEFPNEWEVEMNEFFKNPINHDKTIDLKTIDAKKDWFDTIIDQSKWLLDTHLDVAFEFIRKRMSENTDIFRQKCAIMDTPFHTYLNIRYKLHEENNEPSHWDRDDLLLHFVDGSKENMVSWSNLDRVYFPINITADHWAAGVIDLQEKRIICYDSLIKHTRQETFSNEMKSIATLIPKMLKRANVIDDESPWTIERQPEVPQQQNGSDCGMFCIKFIEILSADKDVTILKPENMGFIRKKFAVETWKMGTMRM
ncbi:uncharacterized protein LOC120007277 [Tripterygium wilfordii]|uniref:uncharacterized protein LOC120007277 n=1 Tax=Tripterygium wilfordii TaxID=458696 RepID=UPI0018F82F37|nr:uncharacterized protein LOC120007277 [Tripterygium wilfordii]